MNKFWISFILSQFLLPLQGHIISSTSQRAFSQDQSIQDREERRRKDFSSARDLLRAHNVPFDPDLLLDYRGWRKTLASTFDRMPEMQTVRRETGPLKGVYLADTLFIPEGFRRAGDTVILVRHLHLVRGGESQDAKSRSGKMYLFVIEETNVVDTTDNIIKGAIIGIDAGGQKGKDGKDGETKKP